VGTLRDGRSLPRERHEARSRSGHKGPPLGPRTEFHRRKTLSSSLSSNLRPPLFGLKCERAQRKEKLFS
jgi:hypothetical protein